jgi:hypothetical protein
MVFSGLDNLTCACSERAKVQGALRQFRRPRQTLGRQPGLAGLPGVEHPAQCVAPPQRARVERERHATGFGHRGRGAVPQALEHERQDQRHGRIRQHFEPGVPARLAPARGHGGVEEAAEHVTARHGQTEHHRRKGQTAPRRGEGAIDEDLRDEVDHERHAKVGPDLETALPAGLHGSLLPSRRGQGNTAQLARGAGGGEFPGERRVLGMHGVDEEIC